MKLVLNLCAASGLSDWSAPPEWKVDKEVGGIIFFRLGDELCIEENINFAGSGIKDNRIEEIFYPGDCQKT